MCWRAFLWGSSLTLSKWGQTKYPTACFIRAGRLWKTTDITDYQASLLSTCRKAAGGGGREPVWPVAQNTARVYFPPGAIVTNRNANAQLSVLLFHVSPNWLYAQVVSPFPHTRGLCRQSPLSLIKSPPCQKPVVSHSSLKMLWDVFSFCFFTWARPRCGAVLLQSHTMAARVSENVWLSLIVKFCQCRYITLKLVFISVCVCSRQQFLGVCDRVCLLWLSQPLGRAKPLDFTEDAANYFLSRPRRLFHPNLDHIELAMFHSMRDR